MVRRSEMSDPEDDDAVRIVARSTAAAPHDPNVLPAGCRLKEYVIESTLGHGGFGIFYLARDEQLYRQGAVKEVMARASAPTPDRSPLLVQSQGLLGAFVTRVRSLLQRGPPACPFDP